MPEMLEDLLSRRAEIVQQFARLGDLHSDSVSNTSGRCGKPNLSAHARRTTSLAGKKTTAAACDQAVQSLEHQFQQILADRHRTGLLDLEAVELAIRSTVHETGAAAIRELLRCHPPGRDHRAIPCACGQRPNMKACVPGRSSRLWLGTDRPTLLLVPACNSGQFPEEVPLAIGKTDFSPGVRRMLAAVDRSGRSTRRSTGRPDQL